MRNKGLGDTQVWHTSSQQRFCPKYFLGYLGPLTRRQSRPVSPQKSCSFHHQLKKLHSIKMFCSDTLASLWMLIKVCWFFLSLWEIEAYVNISISLTNFKKWHILSSAITKRGKAWFGLSINFFGEKSGSTWCTSSEPLYLTTYHWSDQGPENHLFISAHWLCKLRHLVQK